MTSDGNKKEHSWIRLWQYPESPLHTSARHSHYQLHTRACERSQSLSTHYEIQRDSSQKLLIYSLGNQFPHFASHIQPHPVNLEFAPGNPCTDDHKTQRLYFVYRSVYRHLEKALSGTIQNNQSVLVPVDRLQGCSDAHWSRFD